jgi:8-oxo-dGTP pyrophosphatase MutT (NUDIX family)
VTRPAHRRVSRVVLLDEQDRFLLLLTSSPRLATPVTRWITPGGGVEPDESHVQGAVRELFEETGLVVETLGEPIHVLHGQSVFNDGHQQTTYTEFFAHRTRTFTPVTDHWMENEFVDISDVRWWSLDELQGSGELYSPEPLLDIVRSAVEATR